MRSDTSERPVRKSPRLKDYDYAQDGGYFVTICTHNRENLFGQVAQDHMQLNVLGEVVWDCWRDLANHYTNIELDSFVVMPNHVHGILLLTGPVQVVGEGLRPSPTKQHGLPEIVRALKSFSARRINEIRHSTGQKVWQRSFHDHVIRHERELNLLRAYVGHNPAKWMEDAFFTTGM